MEPFFTKLSEEEIKQQLALLHGRMPKDWQRDCGTDVPSWARVMATKFLEENGVLVEDAVGWEGLKAVQEVG